MGRHAPTRADTRRVECLPRVHVARGLPPRARDHASARASDGTDEERPTGGPGPSVAPGPDCGRGAGRGGGKGRRALEWSRGGGVTVTLTACRQPGAGRRVGSRAFREHHRRNPSKSIAAPSQRPHSGTERPARPAYRCLATFRGRETRWMATWRRGRARGPPAENHGTASGTSPGVRRRHHLHSCFSAGIFSHVEGERGREGGRMPPLGRSARALLRYPLGGGGRRRPTPAAARR